LSPILQEKQKNVKERYYKSYAGKLFQRKVDDFSARDRQPFLRSHNEEQYSLTFFGWKIVPERIVRRVSNHFTLKKKKYEIRSRYPRINETAFFLSRC